MENEMKKFSFIVSLQLAALIAFTSCSTNSGTKEDYFGYTTSTPAPQTRSEGYSSGKATTSEKKYIAKSEEDEDNPQWKNPMNNNDINNTYNANGGGSSYANESFADVNYRYNYYPMYVPVVAPWWNNYYGSFGGGWHHPSHFYMSLNYGMYCGYDWFSPWYDYNPYYGYYWPYYYNYGYNSWYHQPYYAHESHHVDRPRSVRNFGPARGTRSMSNGSVLFFREIGSKKIRISPY